MRFRQIAFVIALCCGGMLGALNSAQAQTLRFSAAGDAVTFDPNAHNEAFTMNMMLLVHDALVRRDEKLQIVPALATSWEIVEPTRWRFKLRPGVTFHNGSPLKAEDVVASIERTIDPGARNKGDLASVLRAEIVDDLTVDVILHGPYPLLLNDLAGISIMSKSWLTAHGALKPGNTSTGAVTYASTNANGTGPFKLVTYQPGSRTVLVVNEDWWDKPKHNFKRIEFLPIKSDATRVAALLSGEVDLITDVPLQDIARVGASPDLKVVEEPSLRTVFLGFNWLPQLFGDPSQKNPLHDVRVRRALWHAIDLETLHKRVMRGKSRNAGIVIAPPVVGYSAELDKPLAYDPALAKRLLAEAGYPNGFKATFGCPNDRYIAGEQICVALTAMWSKIGVNAALTMESKSTYFPRHDRGEFDIWIYSTATLPSIDGYRAINSVLSTRKGAYGAQNPGGMSVAAIDEINIKAAVELDESKRRALVTEALRIARDDALIIPLHQQPLAWAMKSKVDMPQLPDEFIRPWLGRMQ